MLKFIFLSLFILSFASAEEGFTPIKPFTTDACSLWPEGHIFNGDKWKECCFQHDISYWIGGTKKERQIADKALKECVKEKGDPINGVLMWVGTRLGGRPSYRTSFRWGYGWPQGRRYGPLSVQEKESVLRELERIDEDAALVPVEVQIWKMKLKVRF